jgi:hypothetical protein
MAGTGGLGATSGTMLGSPSALGAIDGMTLGMGYSATVSVTLGEPIGTERGVTVRTMVGATDGTAVGATDDMSLGAGGGATVGTPLGALMGTGRGTTDRDTEDTLLGDPFGGAKNQGT